MDEEVSAPRKKRCDDFLHKKVKLLTESTIFNGGIIFIILVNALFIAFDTSEVIKELWGNLIFKVMDYTFLAIYTVEFILKLYAEPKNYWRSAYNLFDFLVLMISFAQSIMEWTKADVGANLDALQVLRALRTLRMLRTVSFIRGLQVLVIALIDTIRKWVINIILLLLLLMFLFAIMGYYFFGDPVTGDAEHWGTLGTAMLTVFSFVTVEGWTEFQDIMDEKGYTFGRLYSIAIIFLGHFIFTNVFIGVIIMNISEATENFKREQLMEREAALKHKKEFMMMRQHNDVKQMLERQKRGQYTNFQEMVQEFQKSLHHDDSIMMSDLCTNIIWLETFIRTLDHMDNTVFKLQQLHFEMANVLAHELEDKLKKKYGA